MRRLPSFEQRSPGFAAVPRIAGQVKEIALAAKVIVREKVVFDVAMATGLAPPASGVPTETAPGRKENVAKALIGPAQKENAVTGSVAKVIAVKEVTDPGQKVNAGSRDHVLQKYGLAICRSSSRQVAFLCASHADCSV